MRRIVRLVAVLTALVMVTSACFVIRQFSFSKTNLDISADDITSMRLRLKPDSGTTVLDGYVIILVGIDEELENLNRKEFQDIDGDYGMAPAAIDDAALLAILQDDGECGLPGGGDAEDLVGSFTSWKAFRSNTVVDMSDVDATSRLNFVHNLGISNLAGANEVAQIVAISGSWADTNTNGVPESGEMVCNSAIFTSVTFKA